jgi:hypothetical protein
MRIEGVKRRAVDQARLRQRMLDDAGCALSRHEPQQRQEHDDRLARPARGDADGVQGNESKLTR